MKLLIKNVIICGERDDLIPSNICIKDGKFSFDVQDTFDAEIDFEGDYCSPGFIDIQVYGGNGELFADNPGIESLKAMYDYSLEGGATTILPTIATNSEEIMYRSIDAIKAYQQQGLPGIHGLHLEGPFINATKRGAHIESFIKQPVYKDVEALLEYGKGIIKLITLAPECCDGAILDMIKSYSIKMSIGHSDSTYEQAINAFDKNINLVTHLFNAMPALHHRKPGLATAAMMHPQAMASIVADGFHVNFEIIALAKKIMQERLFLITDAVTNSEGVYPHQLQGEKYVLPDGTLSGSALTMLKAVQNCVRLVGIDVAEAIRMASLYPAKTMGIENETGSIKEGFTADFLRIDKNIILKAVYNAGRQVLPACTEEII
ncbi:MAG: N-acetylglucosamine-6-phosphate deacetylase [Ferruginibacter sp.]